MTTSGTQCITSDLERQAHLVSFMPSCEISVKDDIITIHTIYLESQIVVGYLRSHLHPQEEGPSHVSLQTAQVAENTHCGRHMRQQI